MAYSEEEEPRLQEDDRKHFERAVLPHLGAAYNLARWLMRDEHEAEDLVQEATLRAFKSFVGFHGRDGRAWLLTIVRNSCYSWLQRKRTRGTGTTFDEEIHSLKVASPTPESLLSRKEDRQSVREAVEALAVELREVVVLRELEGMSYKDIAAITDVPMGTVMSRLARGRDRLQELLSERANKES